MIQVENVVVLGEEAAVRGMRNPMNSWEKSDSEKGCTRKTWSGEETNICKNCTYPMADKCSPCYPDKFIIGANDLKLMKSLAKAGSDHAKYLRMINVTCDITAPLYWWKEYDTYKVGTVANSCSTMHKIHAKEFDWGDFSTERLVTAMAHTAFSYTIEALNNARRDFLETKDKKHWGEMIQLLPSSYNQRRTVQLNYQVLANMYFARKNHKLDEWVAFCKWIETLPYFREVIIECGETNAK